MADDTATARRRASDTGRHLFRRRRSLTAALSPVALGRGLLLLTGLLTVAAAPVLDLLAGGWATFLAVSLGMCLVVAASFLVNWQNLPTAALLTFPVLVFAAFTVLSIGQHGLFAPLSGYFTLCYAYAGMTQRPRFSLLLVAPSSIGLVAAYGVFNSQIGVRLVVATSVWVIMAEVLASFTARHATMAAALQTAAHSDALTGLANRRDLEVRLATCEPGTTLVVCDLDHFKRINDTLGHSAGDRVLADFGSTLRAVLRDGDYCARFGGEEFVLVLPATTPPQSERVLERLRLRWELLHPTITFSAGIAMCTADRDASFTLIAADHALYEAKAGGRGINRHELVDTATN